MHPSLNRLCLASAFPLLLCTCLAAQQRNQGEDLRTAKVYQLPQRPAPAGPDLVVKGLDGQLAEWAEPKSGPTVVAQMVRAFVQPALLATEEVQPLGERWLVLLGRPEQHAWLENFLAEAQKNRDWSITLRCEVFRMPEAVYATNVAPALARPDAPAGQTNRSFLAPGAGTDAFRAALQTDARIESLSAPQLSVQSLQPASMAVVSQVSYIRDFDVKVDQGAVIADPVIGVVSDGISIEAAATRLPNDSAGISVNVTVADLKKPIAKFTTTLGVGNPVTIDLPQLLTTQGRIAVDLPRGNTVVFALPAIAGKRYLVLLQRE